MIQKRKEYFDSIDNGKVRELLRLAQPYFAHRADLYNRYRRKPDANTLMSAGNDRTAMSYEHYIAKMAQGYLSGKPPVYTVTESENGNGDDQFAKERADAYQSHIDHIRRYNDDGTVFSDLMFDYLVRTSAYLYIYEGVDNEITYAKLDPSNTVCVYDYGVPPYPVALFRAWTETNDRGDEEKRIEIVTTQSRRVFNEQGEAVPFLDFGEDGAMHTVTEKRLFWSDVPVVAFEEPDGIAVFEPAIPLIDNSETVLTNVSKTLKYNDMAKLMLSGYTPESTALIEMRDVDGNIVNDASGNPIMTQNPARTQEEEDIYNAPAIFLQDGGNVSWLLKNVDFSGALAYLDRIDDFITTFTGVPNINDESFSNAASGVALGYKLYALDQNAAIIDRVFKRGLLRLWEIITNRINLKEGADYDFRLIDISFTRNTPTDKDNAIQRAATLYATGILSLETAISICGLEIDATAEVERISMEKLKIKTMADLRAALAADPPLIDLATALRLLYDDEKAEELLPIIERTMKDRSDFESEFP